MKNKKISRRDRIFIEISSQAKAACGAAAVFQVICRNPHVMHKEMSFSTERLIPNGMQPRKNCRNFDLYD
ncbi:MAG: hypothetical protein LBF04_04855 [Prevotellaceae bacterium]|nr:hypothetical protein [Prevotellaceae bacterium]